ncbi:MAG: hypothetical protein K8F91_20840 [Candidatus Obscuribacterales bacterium]|nr:hypothetical protein [Candidatus Obscuribacterales bacterium]
MAGLTGINEQVPLEPRKENSLLAMSSGELESVASPKEVGFEASSSEKPTSVVVQGIEAFVESGLQNPANGLIQLIERGASAVSRAEVELPRVKIVDLKEAEFGTAAWHGQEIGRAVGMALPFLATRKMLRTSGAGLVTSRLTMAESAVTGASYGFLFQEAEAGKGFLKSRAENALVSGVMFGAFDGATRGVAKLAGARMFGQNGVARALQHEVPASVTGGILVAAGQSEAQALSNGKLLPDLGDLGKNAYHMGFLGMTLGGAGWLAMKTPRLAAETQIAGNTLSKYESRPAATTLSIFSEPPKPFAQMPLSTRLKPGDPFTLVFDSGGAKGAGHIGLLRYLEDANLTARDQFGVSIGSFIATLSKNGYPAAEIQKIMAVEVHQGMLGPILPKNINPITAMKFIDIRPTIEQFVKKYKLKPVDGLHIVTTDLKTRSPVVFTGRDYDLVTALSASMAIPGFFRAVPYQPRGIHADLLGGKNRRLVDGALSHFGLENLPEGTVLFSQLPPRASRGAGESTMSALVSKVANRFVNQWFPESVFTPEHSLFLIPVAKPGVSKFDFFMSHKQYRRTVVYGYREAERHIRQISSNRVD